MVFPKTFVNRVILKFGSFLIKIPSKTYLKWNIEVTVLTQDIIASMEQAGKTRVTLPPYWAAMVTELEFTPPILSITGALPGRTPDGIRTAAW